MRKLLLYVVLTAGLWSCGEKEEPDQGKLQIRVEVVPPLDGDPFMLGNDSFAITMRDGSSFTSDPMLVQRNSNYQYAVGYISDNASPCYNFTVETMFEGKVFDTRSFEIGAGWLSGCKDGNQQAVNLIIP